jgi:hypothetical protein
MKFIMEFGDLTYEEIIIRLRMIADKMDTEHRCPSTIPTGERYYILPSKKDFDEWFAEQDRELRGEQ